MTTRTAPPLAPDLEQGLKRLKLRRMRQLAPELLQTAKTQRWVPEELLRTLVEAEIAARDDANLRNRLRAAGFPQPKRLDDFQLAASSIPRATFDYLASLEWVRAAENACLIGPPGTGKSHVLIGCGLTAVEAGMRPLPARRRARRAALPRPGRQQRRQTTRRVAALRPRHHRPTPTPRLCRRAGGRS